MKYGSLTAVMLVMAAPAFAQQTANPGVAAPDTPRTDTLPPITRTPRISSSPARR
jgi:hypothetical protein